MAEEIIKHLKEEVSKRKDEGHKMQPVGKHMEAAKQALTASGAGGSGEDDVAKKYSRSTRGVCS